MIVVLKAVTIALLMFTTILYAFAFVRQLVANPNALLPLMLDGLGLCLIWITVAVVVRRR